MKPELPDQIPPRRSIGLWSLAWLPLLGFAALMLIRAFKIDGMVGAYTGCQRCILGPMLHHDLIMLAVLAILSALDLLARSAWLRWVLRVSAAAVVLIYALDLAVFSALTQRLYIADLLSFGGEGHAIGGFVAALMKRPDIGGWLAVALLVLVVMSTTLWPRRRRRAAAILQLVLAVLLSCIWALPLFNARYVHPEIVENVAEVNLDNSANKTYSHSFRAELGKQRALPEKLCGRDAQSQRPDLILVAVESLSAYHSALLGGEMDALPQLDALARENHYFTEFVANGFSTNGGRIALYTGRAPLPPPGLARTLPLSAYHFTDDTLISYAHEAGYTTHYFTSGDLGFVNSKPWLQALGFDSIEGAESPFYKGMKRWQFDAPEDKALFDRVLDWIDQRSDQRPYMATLLTVSSHPPFVDPATGKIDQLASFRYVDAQLARFYRQLKERDFFEHGVLMITGDHRSMTPLHADEYQRWGERAFARVPMVVIGPVDMPSVVSETFAHTDVPASFAWLAGIQVCLDPGHGIFTRADPQPPQYVLHASGDRRDRVDVYFGRKHGTVLLDGDDTRWQGDRPDNWQQILETINAQRLQEAKSAHETR